MLRFLPFRTATPLPATHTNCLILGRKRLVVVDPGSAYADEAERLCKFIQNLRRQDKAVLSSIFLTHHHHDHTSGVSLLMERFSDDKPSIFAHEETWRLLPDSLRGLPRHEFKAVLDVDGEHWDVIHTPGHAPGHLCLHHEETGSLIGGDMVASVGSIVLIPPDADLVQYEDSLLRLKELKPSILYPAHGPPIADRDNVLLQRALPAAAGFTGSSRDAFFAEEAGVPPLLTNLRHEPPSSLLSRYLIHRQTRTNQILASLRSLRFGIAAATAASRSLQEPGGDMTTAAWASVSREALADPIKEEGLSLSEEVSPPSTDDSGYSAHAIVDAVYGDTIPDVVKPLAALQVLCHLKALSDRGAVVCSPGGDVLDPQACVWRATEEYDIAA